MLKSLDKRIYLILLTGLTISGFIVICTMGQSVHRRKVAAKISSVSDSIHTSVRTVREYNGRIGVFAGKNSEPYRIIDYDISLLSDIDREALKKGVELSSEYELNRFIEDIAT